MLLNAYLGADDELCLVGVYRVIHDTRCRADVVRLGADPRCAFGVNEQLCVWVKRLGFFYVVGVDAGVYRTPARYELELLLGNLSRNVSAEVTAEDEVTHTSQTVLRSAVVLM